MKLIDLHIYNKIDFIILCVLLIVIFQFFISWKWLIPSSFVSFFVKEKKQESMKSIDKALKDLGDKLKKEVSKAVNALKKEMNKIKDAIMGIFNKIQSAFNEITGVLNSIPRRMKKIEKGFELSMNAIGLEITNLGKGLGLGFTSTFDLIGEGGKTAIGAMECGIEKAQWLPQCFPVYLFDGFLYLNKILFTSIMNASELYFGFNKNYGINYRVVVDYAYNLLNQMDAYAYSFSGVHFMHYPDFIINNCYRCKKLEKTRFKEKAKRVSHAFNQELPKLLNEPVYKFKQAENEFKQAFN